MATQMCPSFVSFEGNFAIPFLFRFLGITRKKRNGTQITEGFGKKWINVPLWLHFKEPGGKFRVMLTFDGQSAQEIVIMIKENVKVSKKRPEETKIQM